MSQITGELVRVWGMDEHTDSFAQEIYEALN